MEIADAVLAKLDEEERQYVDRLAEGGASSYDEYKRFCGVIHGLRTAKQHITDLKNLMESSDE